MKVLSSLKSAKQRPGCQIVKRKGRVFVICKDNPRFKAVQGMKKKQQDKIMPSLYSALLLESVYLTTTENSGTA